MKILLVGAAGVGKTAFVNRLMTGDFNPKYEATRGVIRTKFGDDYEICEFSSQERYSGSLEEEKLPLETYAIVMFNLTDVSSFQEARYWIDRLKQFSPNIKIVLCGNKIDEAGAKLSLTILPENVSLYVTTSFKTNDNVDQLILQ